jgi:predicted MPP superfamily phosphohydrolase
LISAAVLLASLASIVQAYRAPAITRVTVDHSRRYGQGKSVRIAHLSDLHLGIERNVKYIQAIVSMVNAEKPDLIVLTGDTMDTQPEVYAKIAPYLSGFSASQGVFAVTGNHDFYSGVNDFIRMTQAAGVPVIANDIKTTSGGIQVIGVHDGGFGGMRTAETPGTRRELPATLAKLEPGKPSILLQHQPRDIEPAVEKGVDLILSGHTHNGQVWPFTIFARFMYKYLAGLYTITPDTSIVVSQGTGIWGPPMRLLTRSEIVIVELKY